jgi:hypothetical protein
MDRLSHPTASFRHNSGWEYNNYPRAINHVFPELLKRATPFDGDVNAAYRNF